MTDKILDGLSQSQLKAVTTTQGPVLVLAGAGSGKTRVITRRIAYMIRNGVRPWQIMAVTFTNKAADEMAHRIRDLVGEDLRFPYMGTFHSVCYRLLLKHADLLGYTLPFVIYDSDKSRQLAKAAAKSIGYSAKEEITTFSRKLLRYIERYKNEGISQPPPPRNDSDALLAKAADYYAKGLREANAMDFGDLLVNTLVLFQENPDLLREYQDRIQRVMVDEFQDTNPVQYHIVKAIAGEHRNLCVVGDDDQSIYSWRGATIANILNFDKDFPEAVTVYLVDNYRSKGAILRAASAVVKLNSMRHKKELKPTKDQGSPIIMHVAEDAKDEAEYIADVVNILTRKYSPREVAVFFRTNAQSRPIEEVFVRRNIPYKLVGAHKFFDRKEIRDLLAYLELVVNPNDDIALRRVINSPPRGIGPKTVAQAANLAQEGSLFDGLTALNMGGARGKAIKAFVGMITDLHDRADDLTVFEMLKEVIKRTGYLDILRASKAMEDLARAENIEQLLLDVKEFSEKQDDSSTLAYLGATSLRKGESVDGDIGVSLMTVHAAKGLEFDAVVVAGMVEGLFPHKNSVMDLEKIEEERRLMYVAMTRAKERLILTLFRRMLSYGSGWSAAFPSRFLKEIPKTLLRKA